jgi:uncharacterized protein (DUF2252 family)
MKSDKDLPYRIKSFNTDRLPSFLKMKYDAMYNDRYRFFRATAHLFFEDISTYSFLQSTPHTWLCGDLHLENYGSYKGDNRLAYFNVNDFDECILGPCSFDIVRMLCSIFVASGNLGVTKQDADYLCNYFTNTYFEKLEQGYIRVLEKETTKGIVKEFLTEIESRKRKKFLESKTILKKNGRKLIIDNIHLVALPDSEKEQLVRLYTRWSEKMQHAEFYKIRDIAIRIAGTSSLGLRRYAVLIEGKGSPNENYLLEMKESRKSCGQKYSKAPQPKWKNEAHRIIEVQRRVLSDPPALLNSIDLIGRNYVMKELQPIADRIDYNLFKGNIKKLKQILGNMASIYAWGSLRSSGRQNSAIADDLIAFARNEKAIKKELVRYAYHYSKTINAYHNSFCKAFDKKYFKIL